MHIYRATGFRGECPRCILSGGWHVSLLLKGPVGYPATLITPASNSRGISQSAEAEPAQEKLPDLDKIFGGVPAGPAATLTNHGSNRVVTDLLENLNAGEGRGAMACFRRGGPSTRQGLKMACKDFGLAAPSSAMWVGTR